MLRNTIINNSEIILDMYFLAWCLFFVFLSDCVSVRLKTVNWLCGTATPPTRYWNVFQCYILLSLILVLCYKKGQKSSSLSLSVVTDATNDKIWCFNLELLSCTFQCKSFLVKAIKKISTCQWSHCVQRRRILMTWSTKAGLRRFQFL